MERKVGSGTILIIKGRTFELVWEDSVTVSAPCLRCALHDDLCQYKGDYSLIALCAYIQPEPLTYFVERKPDFTPEGLNEQEILITALMEYKKVMEAAGNSARALKVLKMLDRI